MFLKELLIKFSIVNLVVSCSIKRDNPKNKQRLSQNSRLDDYTDTSSSEERFGSGFSRDEPIGKLYYFWHMRKKTFLSGDERGLQLLDTWPNRGIWATFGEVDSGSVGPTYLDIENKSLFACRSGEKIITQKKTDDDKCLWEFIRLDPAKQKGTICGPANYPKSKYCWFIRDVKTRSKCMEYEKGPGKGFRAMPCDASRIHQYWDIGIASYFGYDD